MRWKSRAALLAAALIALPARAWDFREQDRPYTYLFLRIPLDGQARREKLPVWGFAVRGRRDYQAFSLDSQSLDRFAEMGFVESKLLVVGAVAAAGALAVGAAGSQSASSDQRQLQAAQQAAATQPRAAGCPPAPQPPCPR